MTEAEGFVIWPTVIVRLDDEEGRIGVVAVGEGEEKAVIVFRGPEEAQKYQEYTGKHGPGEGFKLIGVGEEALAAILEDQGLGYVAMPEPWVGGDGGVDLFEAENFIALLEESLVN